MAFNIDYDRGVTFNMHGPSGVNVYMYDGEPGVFRNAHGTLVSDELAQQAGFDVATLKRKRLMKERMKDAMDKITAELATEETKARPVRARGGFKVMDIGFERFQVVDPDGTPLTDKPLPRQQAEALLVQLTPDAPDEDVPETPEE